MFRNARERIGARGLVLLLAAAPLLGAVPMQDANGGIPSAGHTPVARQGGGEAVPGKPKPSGKPKADGQPASPMIRMERAYINIRGAGWPKASITTQPSS